MTTSLEITVISAQGIINNKTPLSPFSLFFFFSPPHHLRPFITITTLPPPPPDDIDGCKGFHVYTTRVDDEGGPNPTWGDKFLLPLDPTFFTTNISSSCIYIHLYTKRAFMGRRAHLGWAQIPASDILDGPAPLGLARNLSYRIRARDGSRGHGVVNVALRLVGQVPVVGSSSGVVGDTWRTAIGVPVGRCLMTCQSKEMDNVTRHVSTRSED